MPYLNIKTNQTIENPVKLIQKASQTIAKVAGKPESYVMVVVESGLAMSFGGSDAPAAFLDYRSLGLPTDRKAFSAVLCDLITAETDVEGARTYISMTDAERQNWGWDHSTF